MQWIAAPHLEYGAAGLMEGYGIPISDSDIKLPYARRILESRDTADDYTFTGINPLSSWARGAHGLGRISRPSLPQLFVYAYLEKNSVVGCSDGAVFMARRSGDERFGTMKGDERLALIWVI